MGQLAICQMKYLPSFLALLLGLAKQNKTKKKKRIPLAKEIPICPQIWFTLSQKSMVLQGKG